jgi:uncharacterized protein YkwD
MYNLMNISLIIFLGTMSLMAQSQYKTGDTITTQDKLRFLDSLNKYRILAGVEPLEYSFQEDSLAKLRTETIFKHIDSISEEEYKSDWMEHQHHRFIEDVRRYDKSNIHKDTVINWSAECSARISKLNNPDDLVDELFQGWKNSKAHWKMMLEPKFKYIVLDWFIDNQRHIRIRKGTISSLVLFSKRFNENSRGNP